MNKNINNFNEDEHRINYQKEIEIAKKLFLNKKFIVFFVVIFILLLFLAEKYKFSHIGGLNKNINANSVNIDSIISDSEKAEPEKDEKIKIISDVLGDHQIRFADQDLKFKGFFSPEDGVMSAIYSDDILSYQPSHEVIVYQYQNKISASELFDKELLHQAKSSYDAKYLKTNQYDNNYLIILSDLNYDSSIAFLYLIKIFEKDGRIYKISYQKNVNEDAINVARYWVNEDYKVLVDEFKDADVFSNIDISYAQKIFNDSFKIKENLSKNDVYRDVKWETKTIIEDNAHADINLEYPEFKGFYSANNLNKIITNIVLGTLEEDRKFIEEWKKDEKNSYTDGEGDIISDCHGDQDYFYSCSVNLHSSFKVKSILNNIISLEIILTDYTGGGNGNHSYVKTIIYDLKNGKQLFIDDLFCGDGYLEKIKDILMANLFISPVFDNSLKYLNNAELLSYLREVSFDDLGIILSFNPYTYTAGAYGIYNIFIPYAILEDNLCFKDGGNNDILIRRSLLNLDVPAELSDSCGSDNCDGLSFYKGVFNDMDSRNYSRDYASIHISIEDYKTGYLLNNGKREKIVAVPYVWQWASSGVNLYVLKINNNSLIPLSKMNVGKGMPQNLKIEDNKIFFSYINLDDSIISRECYFKDNIIKESNLICSQGF